MTLGSPGGWEHYNLITSVAPGADSDCLSNKDVIWLAIQPCLIIMIFQCN